MMTMQRTCQIRRTAVLVAAAWLCGAPIALADSPVHDYPTVARVEFVQECITRHGGKLENLDQC